MYIVSFLLKSVVFSSLLVWYLSKSWRESVWSNVSLLLFVRTFVRRHVCVVKSIHSFYGSMKLKAHSHTYIHSLYACEKKMSREEKGGKWWEKKWVIARKKSMKPRKREETRREWRATFFFIGNGVFLGFGPSFVRTLCVFSRLTLNIKPCMLVCVILEGWSKFLSYRKHI